MASWFGFADGRPLDTLVHIRAAPAPRPVRCVFRTRFVHGGMFEEDGEVWDSDGTLVVLSRQLALLPR